MITRDRPLVGSGPPSPPVAWFGRGGGGGGGKRRLPWQIWLCIPLLVGTLVLGYRQFWVGLFTVPFPVIAATIGAAAAMWIARRHILTGTNRYLNAITFTAIAAGMLGETLQYLTVGLPSGAPHGFGWVLVGVTGIGGSVGLLVGLLAMLTCAAVLLVQLVRGWYAA